MKAIFEEGNSLVKITVSIDERASRVLGETELKRIIFNAKSKTLKNVRFYINDEILTGLGTTKLKELK